MLVTRAYRHKARLTGEQEMLARRFAGCARLIYNSGLEQRRLGYEVTGRGMGYKAQTYGLKDVRADPDFAFLREAPAHVLQQALRDLDRAFKNFFEGRTRYPRPRKRGEHDAFRYPDPDPKQIGVHEPGRIGQVRLPKPGWVSVTNCYPRLKGRGRLFEGELKSVTVAREGDGWHVSFCCEVELADPVAPAGAHVGVDLGIANSLATSTGELLHLPVISEREWARIGVLQSVVNRREKGSRNRDKAKRRLARYRHKLVRRKRDAIHQLTSRLTGEHPVIVAEDLRVANMTRSAKGSVEEPGVNVAQKSGLNRSILDQCWGETRRQLAYKSAWRGGHFEVVAPKNTSRSCPACGTVADENRESQAVFCCVACGHEAHADINAARNILQLGLAKLGLEVPVRPAGGTPEGALPGLDACAGPVALKAPERPAPSRKTRPRGRATKASHQRRHHGDGLTPETPPSGRGGSCSRRP